MYCEIPYNTQKQCPLKKWIDHANMVLLKTFIIKMNSIDQYHFCKLNTLNNTNIHVVLTIC